MTFVKGVSGNPGGRPKKCDDVVELARSYTVEAIERLAFWMRGKNPKASVAASLALLDRGYGKAVQPIVNYEKHDAADWARDELVAFLHDSAESRKRTAAQNGRGTEPDSVH
mgnify:CR=1 FL=1